MRTLAIETATAACSVALADGDDLVGHAHEVVGRGHAERLVPMIAGLADRGRADRILVDVGPGSFTGVRVGLAAARALALAWGAEVRGYSSLALVAARARADGRSGDGGLVVVLVGGHGEFFVQGFDSQAMPTAPFSSLAPDDVRRMIDGRPAFGSGAPGFGGTALDPDARDIRLLPPDLRALPARPLYGRGPDARLPA